METALRYSAVAVAAVICALILKEAKSGFSLYVIMFAGIGILGALINVIPAIKEFAAKAAAYAPELNEGWSALLKTVGITLVTRLAGQTCRDCGEGSLAMKLEMLGTLLAVVTALPLAEAVLSIIAELLVK